MSTGSGTPPRILITPGEPAGIGVDLLCDIAAQPWSAQIVAVADPELLAERAQQLGGRITPQTIDLASTPTAHVPGQLPTVAVPLAEHCQPGSLNPANATYVLRTLEIAADACLNGQASALVTGPVQKSVINDAGIAFSGHTEFLAARCGDVHPVMMLVADTLRVALATTHLPLRHVADAITQPVVEHGLRILCHDLQRRFRIADPCILVCGLNPHAGEGGHLGREEIDIITPVLERLRAEGYHLEGPLPADTLFVPHHLQKADAVFVMYHDQGLPVLKHAGFGDAVNVTLGLPLIRTSVDHGTALSLAGSGRAHSGSLRAALRLAIELAANRQGTA